MGWSRLDLKGADGCSLADFHIDRERQNRWYFGVPAAPHCLNLVPVIFNGVAYTIGWIILHIVGAGVLAMSLDTFKPHSTSPDNCPRKWMVGSYHNIPASSASNWRCQIFQAPGCPVLIAADAAVWHDNLFVPVRHIGHLSALFRAISA
jgi:hypothetical protein